MSALTAAIDASLLPRAQPRTPLRLVVVSAVPGRVRWFLPELRDREELAAALARTLSALPSVPVVLAVGAIVFIGLAASAVPVRRVTGIDPAISLRSE